MNPLPGDVHVNAPLTNISIAFVQDERKFVARRVFQIIPSQKQSDVFFQFDRGNFNRDEMKVRAPGTESSGGSYTVDGSPNFFCLPYAFHKDIPDQLRSNADSPLNLDREATLYVTTKGLIRMERHFATNYFKASVWTEEKTGVGSSAGTGQFLRWDDANSTPIEDIRGQCTEVEENTGFRPNVLTLQRRVFDKLVDHPDLVDRVKYGGSNGAPAMVNMQALAALFEVDEVLVMGGIYNTAKEGATNVHTFIGAPHALLTYRPPAPGIMTPAAGYTFTWNGYLGATPNGNRIKKFRHEVIESDRIENQLAFDQKLISADLGAIFLNCVTINT